MNWFCTWKSGLLSISVLAGCLIVAAAPFCRENTVSVDDQANSGVIGAPPEGAVSAGFDRVIFREELNDASGIDLNDTRKPGFNFYPKLIYGDYVLPAEYLKVEDGVLHLFNPNNHAQGDIFSAVSAGQPKEWTGFTASKENGGAYFEASIAFDPTTEPVNGFPAFWTMAAENFFGCFDTAKPYQFLEIDCMEYNWKWYEDPTDYLHCIHCWYQKPGEERKIVTLPRPASARVINTPPGTDYNKFNIFGCLWVPGEDGRIDTYFNNQLVRSVSFREYPEGRISDDHHFPVFLGCGNWPIQVDWVRVWARQ